MWKDKGIIKQKMRKIAQFLLNPRLIFCLGIAWMITNGWSYLLFGIGTYFQIEWMIGVASAYLAWLWLPVSPEKVATVAIAITLLRWLFPKDEKTLAVLQRMHQRVKSAIKGRKKKERDMP